MEDILNIRELMQEAVREKASDLHITVGKPPILRINGSLFPMDKPKLQEADTHRFFEDLISGSKRETLLKTGEVDFSIGLRGFSRFRINAYKQRGSIAIAIRLIPEHVPTLAELELPPILETFAMKPRGLVLVTGPTGSGKSTTLAGMIDLINSHRSCNIITLEDPIEYLHRHKKSIINQREVGTDTQNFSNGLRAALREDPDVILVGEMRDVETIGIAVQAAETGHLVLATLHTVDASQTVDRIIDSFPTNQQQQVRMQLSMTLQGIVSQQLLPRKDGSGRIAAVEVLVATPAARNLIREGKGHQLLSVIQTSARAGMQSMDAALRDLCRAGIVSDDEALSRAMDPEHFLILRNGR